MASRSTRRPSVGATRNRTREDDRRQHLPNRVTDEGHHQRGGADAGRGRQDRSRRSGQPLHSRYAEDERRGQEGGGGIDIVPAKRTITITDLLTHTAAFPMELGANIAPCTSRRGSTRGRLRLVHRGQGRTRLPDDGTAGLRAPSWRSPAKSGARLQHRHPRLRGGARIGSAARSVLPAPASSIRSGCRTPTSSCRRTLPIGWSPST